jgi:flavorubredoxin
MAVAVAGMIFLFLFLSWLATRKVQRTVTGRDTLPLWEKLRLLWGNRHFFLLLLAKFVFYTGVSMLAPDAQVSCSRVGALVSVNDFIGREARGLADGDTFTTGKYRFRHVQTPHLPHGWDAGVLHEETQGTLFCSDLFHQTGACAPITADDVVGRSHEAMRQYQAGILADYMPYTPITGRNLEKLAALEPKTLAVMHGSSFRGDGRKAIHDIHAAFRDVFGASVTPDKAP